MPETEGEGDVLDDRLDPSSVVASPPMSQPPYSAIASQGQNPQILGPPDFPDNRGGGIVGVSIQQRGSNDAFIEKMTAAHIEKMIELDDKDKGRRHTQNLVNSGIAIGGFVILVVAIIVLCVVFLMFNRPEYLQGILGLLVGILGGGTAGFGTGFGIGRATAPKPQETTRVR